MLREKCERCGLSYAFADSGDGPAVFAIFILGFLVLGGALLVEFKLGPPVWVHVVLWGLLTPLLAFVLLRVLKATLIALQYKHKAEEGRLRPGLSRRHAHSAATGGARLADGARARRRSPCWSGSAPGSCSARRGRRS